MDKFFEPIIDVVAPIMIPTPFVGKYNATVKMIDLRNIIPTTLISVQDNNKIIKMTSINNDTEIKKYIIESIFNFQESIIIYNTIVYERVMNVDVWNLEMIVKQNNQQFACDYSTNDKKQFLNYLIYYMQQAKMHNMDGLHDKLNTIIKHYDEKYPYKFKTKRKSLLGENIYEKFKNK